MVAGIFRETGGDGMQYWDARHGGVLRCCDLSVVVLCCCVARLWWGAICLML